MSNKINFFSKTIVVLGIFFTLTLFDNISKAETLLDNKAILSIIMKDRYALENDTAIHTPNKEIIEKYPDFYSDEQTFETKVLLKHSFVENNMTKTLIITESDIKYATCHICSPVVGIAILYKDKNVWKIEDSYDYTEKIGTFGTTPKPKIYENTNKNKLIVFEDSYSGMGNTIKNIHIIAKVKNKFKQVFYDEETYYDNFGTCGNVIKTPCVKYYSKFDFIKNNKTYQDIKVTKLGTNFDNTGKVKKVKEVKKYYFTSDYYKQVKDSTF